MERSSQRSCLRHAIAYSPQLSLYFLAPALLMPCRTQVSPFSTSPTHSYPRRDKSRFRGMSALHRSGLRKEWKLSVLKHELPKPVVDLENPTDREYEVNPEHGLWAFFNENRKPMNTPEQDHAHGRAWTMDELRQKSWNDLHSLWWVCLKDINRTLTSQAEAKRVKAGFGEYESGERIKTVRATQRAIKNALRERWYAWEDARKLWDAGQWDGFSEESPYEEDDLTGQQSKIERPASGRAGDAYKST